MWECSICLVFTAIALRTLVRHIAIQHASQPNFKVKCMVDGCLEQYSKMDSFRKHLRRKHWEELRGNNAGEQPADNASSSNTSDHASDSDHDISEDEVQYYKSCSYMPKGNTYSV